MSIADNGDILWKAKVSKHLRATVKDVKLFLPQQLIKLFLHFLSIQLPKRTPSSDQEPKLLQAVDDSRPLPVHEPYVLATLSNALHKFTFLFSSPVRQHRDLVALEVLQEEWKIPLCPA
jgi:hypothetical protein